MTRSLNAFPLAINGYSTLTRASRFPLSSAREGLGVRVANSNYAPQLLEMKS
jgi:hypothetical protein